MSIFKRFKNVVAANANARLDEMENPSAMLDQYIRNMQKDLADVKADTANVMAVEKGIERKIDIITKDIASLQSFANKAVTEGNDDDARTFLAEKTTKESELAELEASLEIAKANTSKMVQMHNALSSDIQAASDKRAILKSKVKVVKTQSVINKTASSYEKSAKNLSEFSRLEEKINSSLDAAYSMELLNGPVVTNEIEDLKNKYTVKAYSDKVEAELAELKKAN